MLFDELYQDKSTFFPDDVEVDLLIFNRRLDQLATFLKKMGDVEAGAKKISRAIRSADTKAIKIESLTTRVFDNYHRPILSKNLIHTDAKATLFRFCQQKELSKEGLLEFVDRLKMG